MRISKRESTLQGILAMTLVTTNVLRKIDFYATFALQCHQLHNFTVVAPLQCYCHSDMGVEPFVGREIPAVIKIILLSMVYPEHN